MAPPAGRLNPPTSPAKKSGLLPVWVELGMIGIYDTGRDFLSSYPISLSAISLL